MSLVTLPSSPGPMAVAWELRDFGGTLQGALGGAAQRVNRLGNRWKCEITLPPLTPEQAREWSAALVKGRRNGVRWSVRQVGTPTGSPGAPRVNGGSQAGDTLACDGFNDGYVVKAGQFFHIETATRRYLHQVAASGRPTSGAFAALPIEPPLRVSPADNAVLEFGAPTIEGLLVEVPGWSLDPDRIARGFTFAIEEVR